MSINIFLSPSTVHITLETPAGLPDDAADLASFVTRLVSHFQAGNALASAIAPREQVPSAKNPVPPGLPAPAAKTKAQPIAASTLSSGRRCPICNVPISAHALACRTHRSDIRLRLNKDTAAEEAENTSSDDPDPGTAGPQSGPQSGPIDDSWGSN